MVEALSGLAAVERAAGRADASGAVVRGRGGAARDHRGAYVAGRTGGVRPPGERSARAELDETALANAWAEGRAMTLEQAVADALEAAPVDRMTHSQQFLIKERSKHS